MMAGSLVHACKVPQRRSHQGAGQGGTWISAPSSAFTGGGSVENMLCTKGIWKWSLTGQDKPLLPSTGEYQLLVPQKGYRVKISSSFPSFCSVLYLLAVSCPLAADCSKAEMCSGFLLCMWAQSKADFSKIMAFLKEKAVVKSGVLLCI